MNTLKTQENILADLKGINDAQIDYSDIAPMTEEERKTAQLYYKDFLDKLPPDLVKNLIDQRISEASPQ
jgi:U3 small nucleolar ribonucleoprotein component